MHDVHCAQYVDVVRINRFEAQSALIWSIQMHGCGVVARFCAEYIHPIGRVFSCGSFVILMNYFHNTNEIIQFDLVSFPDEAFI